MTHQLIHFHWYLLIGSHENRRVSYDENNTPSCYDVSSVAHSIVIKNLQHSKRHTSYTFPD
ncbi:unnamed protein product [Schistosoma mattheei]|uniref:Uncharacterized protein n=1 Tax=Schistosoma mattheei TaxID=31246 RepID=A0A3P8EN80_9TREM|nr:unnamed protein product [Schistosoma mattheei]